MSPIGTICRSFTLGLSLIGLGSLMSAPANATYYWDVTADAGSFAPVALGDDITLDACSSRLTVANNPSGAGTSICNLTNISYFSVNWFAKNITTGAFSWLTGGLGSNQSPNLYSLANGTAAANRQTTTSTGSGTFFDSVGTYAVGVYVASTTTYTNFTESISNGGTPYNYTAAFGSDFTSSLSYAFSSNGYLNNAAAWSSNFTISEPVTVPEPAPLLLLLPAMVWIARRERKRSAQRFQA